MWWESETTVYEGQEVMLQAMCMKLETVGERKVEAERKEEIRGSPNTIQFPSSHCS